MERARSSRGEGARVALVDVDAAALDDWRARVRGLGLPPEAAHQAEIRLVIQSDPSQPAWRWAELASVPRAGEVSALSGVLLDAVVIGDSPRRETAARLAAALGARVLFA